MGEENYLDPFLVLESLRHGCLPLQCVPESSHGDLSMAYRMAYVDSRSPFPHPATFHALTPEEQRGRRIDAGLSVILAGSLERDLARFVPATAGERT